MKQIRTSSGDRRRAEAARNQIKHIPTTEALQLQVAEVRTMIVRNARRAWEDAEDLYNSTLRDFPNDTELIRERAQAVQFLAGEYERVHVQYAGGPPPEFEDCTCSHDPNRSEMACGVCRRQMATRGVPFAPGEVI
jgi:hypothetical protein